MGHATFRKTPISLSTQDKNPMPRHLFECNPEDEVPTGMRTDSQLHRSEKATDSKYNLTRGLSPREHLERQAEFHASTQDEA